MLIVRNLGALALFFLSLKTTLAAPQSLSPRDIPQSEQDALEGIVEDDPNDAPQLRDDDDEESPAYNLMFRNPLPIPPVKQPRFTVTDPNTGADIRYYEIEIKPFTQQIYPNLRPANLVGYDGRSPGPTILVPRGTATVVRFINRASMENSVHLHGSPTRAPWDGWAEDVTFPGQYKDYYYPNQQSARFLWYHDHAMHITAENAYFGQAGAYIIEDPAEAALGLPTGYGTFDIPLVLSSKFYNRDGTLRSTVTEDESVWGDIIHVNGQPWPFMNVEPRKYRFRILNASVSRSFALYFAITTSLKAKIPFQVIASDAGLLTGPQTTSQLFASMAERWEIVFDFSKYKGQTIELRNLEDVGDIGTDDDYDHTDSVMRFVVAQTLSKPDTSVVPSALRTVPFPNSAGNSISHHFRFHRSNGQWLINDVGFADVQNRLLADVPRGTVQRWTLENGSGGWTHPIHIHLVDFRVISRSGGRGRGVENYERAGLKDVVWLAKGETAVVEAHYAPYPGVYMFHCHNLIHEDQDMMAAFNVTVLDSYGYNSSILIDPMEQRFRAKPFVASDISARSGAFSDASIKATINGLAALNAYSAAEQAA